MGGGGGPGIRGSGGSGWGSVWGVRVDVNEELKFLGKFKKNNLGCRGEEEGCGGRGGGGGSGRM